MNGALTGNLLIVTQPLHEVDVKIGDFQYDRGCQLTQLLGTQGHHLHHLAKLIDAACDLNRLHRELDLMNLIRTTISQKPPVMSVRITSSSRLPNP
jgi:hypothetical protein